MTNTNTTLNTESLEPYFKAVTITYLDVHNAYSERQKSQALRDHTAALLTYIDAVDRLLPESLPTAIPPTIAGHSYNHSTTTTTNATTTL